ncbi:MAG: GTPase ObgE [Phycisphaeraceae bacterium]
MLVDRAEIYVQAGRGGDGALSFRRESYVPKGGPDGGDGGDGGHVYLKATPGVDTLLDMAGRHHWRAQHGEPGMSKSRTGARGDSLHVLVPPGTLVFDAETDELIVDLDDPGKEILIARGGKAGKGNERFKSATNQVPRQFTPGEKGEQRHLRLELKLIADVGLVGKPNAGKSTLLSRTSAATPKVADYPFTTLEPQLGIAELTGHRRLVMADIPGLIEGAHKGAGLGHDFLRHIERTRILVHVLEVEPLDGSDPIDNYHVIRRELREHNLDLSGKRQIIALNKMDLMGDAEDQQVAVEMMEQALGLEVMPISAATGTGCEALLERCWAVLKAEGLKMDAPER